jgi:thioredoxin 1
VSWLGYFVLAFLAVLAANALWVLLGSRQLRGRSVEDLAGIDPELGNHWGKAAIYCYSADCGPCRRIAPAIDALRVEHPELLKLNIAERASEARRLGIQVTPTILLIEDGKILKALVGVHGFWALKVFLGAG